MKLRLTTNISTSAAIFSALALSAGALHASESAHGGHGTHGAHDAHVEAKPATARKKPADPKPKKLVTDVCAVVENFQGEVQVLDQDRTRIDDGHQGTLVPCGGWVSTENGWVELLHRDGARVHLGPRTFIGVRDERKSNGIQDGAAEGDHLILFRGEIFALTGRGRGAISAVTPNARARMSRSAAILVYSAAEEDSQLIALEDSATLENRFEPSRKVTVKAGEASSLNFQLLRVIPSTPRAVAQAALKPRMKALHVPSRDRSRALRFALQRADRKFASPLAADLGRKHDRGPASEGSSKGGAGYGRYPAGAMDPALKEHFLRRLSGGDRDISKMLSPDRPLPGASKNSKVQVGSSKASEDSGDREEESEKRKLIEALSRVGED